MLYSDIQYLHSGRKGTFGRRRNEERMTQGKWQVSGRCTARGGCLPFQVRERIEQHLSGFRVRKYVCDEDRCFLHRTFPRDRMVCPCTVTSTRLYRLRTGQILTDPSHIPGEHPVRLCCAQVVQIALIQSLGVGCMTFPQPRVPEWTVWISRNNSRPGEPSFYVLIGSRCPWAHVGVLGSTINYDKNRTFGLVNGRTGTLALGHLRDRH